MSKKGVHCGDMYCGGYARKGSFGHIPSRADPLKTKAEPLKTEADSLKTEDFKFDFSKYDVKNVASMAEIFGHEAEPPKTDDPGAKAFNEPLPQGWSAENLSCIVNQL